MPFEPGNQLRARQMMVEQTIRRVLAQDKADRLRRAVERLFDDAADGETWQQRHAALAWIADRTDGKAIARSEQVDGDVRSMTLQDVARLVMQARALEATDAPTTLPAARQDPPGGAGDTPIKAQGGEGVVAVGPTPMTAPRNESPSGS